MRSLSSFILPFLVGAFACPALAQEYPTKPITIVVPNSAGGGPDLVARAAAGGMTKVLGTTIVVENRPGADWSIGLEYVAKKVPADGYTIVFIFDTALVTLPVIMKDLRFDPLKDLTPVIGVAEARLVLASNIKVPWKTFNEFVTYAKSNPGKLNYGVSSTAQKLIIESILKAPANNLDMIDIHYSGGGQMVQAAMAGDIQLAYLSPPSLKTGTLRALAVSGATRLSSIPDVPTFTELGLPYVQGATWSLLARIGTPQPLINKLFTTTSSALQLPEVGTALARQDAEATGDRPEVVARRNAESARVYADIARAVGIQPQ